MPRPSELELKRLALLEFRTKTTAKQAARNIRQMLGPSSIKFKQVEDWFRSFKNGTTNIFPVGSQLHKMMQSHKNDRDNGLSWLVHTISTVDVGEYIKDMMTIDGRLFLRVDDDRVTVLDVFHGHVRQVTRNFITLNQELGGHLGDRSWKMIDNAHLLSYQCGFDRSVRCLELFQIDCKEWRMKSMAFEKVTSMAVNRLVVDQSDRRKFLVTSNSAFMTGVVTETSIHVDGAKTSNAFNGLIMIKMKGRKVYGIRMQKNQPMKFLVLDLDTLKEETFDLLTHTVDGLVVDIHHALSYGWAWSDSRLYVAQSGHNALGYSINESRILSFDAETRLWSETNVSVPMGYIHGLFVDRNEVLTVRMPGHHDTPHQEYFGRFPMKKPDSLKNLAWLTMLNTSKLFGTGTYDRIINRLPYNCEFRSLAPDECEDLDDIKDESVKTSDLSDDSD